MRFGTAFESDIGTEFTVSNGKPEPERYTDAWRRWFSHNFTGVMGDKGGTEPARWIKVQFQKDSSTLVGFIILESSGDSLYSSALSAAALALYRAELLDEMDRKAESLIAPLDALLLYAKWQEVRDVNSIGLAAALALPAAERTRRFPFLVAMLTERPELTPQQALDYFTTQTEAKIAKAGRLEARRDNLKRLISEATTQADMEAAAQGNWSGI